MGAVAYHPRTMTFDAGPSIVRMAPRLRLGLLLVVALFTAHDAVYVAQFGLGGRLAEVMTERGHDGYWVGMLALAGVALVLLAAMTGSILLGLRRRLRTVVPLRREHPSGSSYLGEVLRLWRVLLPATLLLFGLQENLEYLVAHGDVIGIEAVIGPNAPLALPVLALVTLALAALGGLVRWRIAAMEARLARSIARVRRRIEAAAPPREWRTIHAAAPHRWTLGRLDAGRAPPRTLPA